MAWKQIRTTFTQAPITDESIWTTLSGGIRLSNLPSGITLTPFDKTVSEMRAEGETLWTNNDGASMYYYPAVQSGEVALAYVIEGHSTPSFNNLAWIIARSNDQNVRNPYIALGYNPDTQQGSIIVGDIYTYNGVDYIDANRSTNNSITNDFCRLMYEGQPALIENIVIPNSTQTTLNFNDLAHWKSSEKVDITASGYTGGTNYANVYQTLTEESWQTIFSRNVVELKITWNTHNIRYSSQFAVIFALYDNGVCVAGNDQQQNTHTYEIYEFGFKSNIGYLNSNITRRIDDCRIAFGVDHDAQKGYIALTCMFYNGAKYPTGPYYQISDIHNAPGIGTKALYDALVKASMTIYTWTPVSRINGKMGNINLSQIIYLNDGDPVSGADSEDVNFTDASNLEILIQNAVYNNDAVTVTYDIPSGDYEYIKLVYKYGNVPEDIDDGTAIDITQDSTECVITDIENPDNYWFIIFTDKTASVGYELIIDSDTAIYNLLAGMF